jgi:Uma2 family endonuclease
MTATITSHTPNLSPWRSATWADYENYRDRVADDQLRLFFHNGYLRIETMGWEGIVHAEVNQLFNLLIGLWCMAHPEQQAQLLGGCLMEKPGQQAAAPDLVLYVGDNVPTWKPGEPRRIDLDRWQVPDLVGEISDTTLASDLDEMKQLYAALGVPEYWVIDVQGNRVWAFRLQADGKYQECAVSVALNGLPIALLQQTLLQLAQGTNITAANWFTTQIATLKE